MQDQLPNLTIVMYHYVRPIADSTWPRIKGLELENFKGQLDYLQQHHTLVSVPQILAAANGGPPLSQGAALLTFDDGYADHYRHAFPEMRKRGLSGAFFPPASAVLESRVLDVNKIHFLLASADDTSALVTEIENAVEEARSTHALKSLEEYRAKYRKPNRFDTAEVIYIKRMLQVALPETLRTQITDRLFGRHVTTDEKSFAAELYCSAAQLKEMAAFGMTVGGHGYAHNWLNSLTRQDQAKDIDASMAMLQSIDALEQGFTFCYPYGAYNADTLELLKERNCAAAFTTIVGAASVAPAADMLQLPRFDTNDLPHAAQKQRKHMQ